MITEILAPHADRQMLKLHEVKVGTLGRNLTKLQVGEGRGR